MRPDTEGVKTSHQNRRLTSVLATDICGYSALSESDEQLAIEAVVLVHAILEATAIRYYGRIFNQAGDGFMVEFPSASDCVDAALDFLTRIQTDKSLSQLPNSTRVRIGLHVGDVVEQKNGDLLGHGVNVAARLQEEARENGILASANIVNLVSSSFEGKSTQRGSIQLKKMSQTIIAYDLEPANEIVQRFDTKEKKHSLTIKIAVSGAVLALLTFVSIFVVRDASRIPAKVAADVPTDFTAIDRRALRAALAPLIDTGRPIDAAVSALIETNDFDAAIKILSDEHLQMLESPFQEGRIALLHQIGALSFDRDTETALRVYRQIYTTDSTDSLASWQLARLYQERSEYPLAKEMITRSLSSVNASDGDILRYRIAAARINAPPFDTARNAFLDIANAASQMEIESLELDALTYALTYDYLFRAQNEISTTDFLESMERKIFGLIDRQKLLGLDQQIARNYIQLGAVQKDRGRQQLAIQTFKAALNLERILERPAYELQVLSNLARAHYELDDFNQASTYNSEAIQLAMSADLLSTVHYNRALAARISFAQGDLRAACALMREATENWPADYASDERLASMRDEVGCT